MSLSYKLTYKMKVYMAESPVCKIPRKIVHTVFILLGTVLACWIYWKPMAEKNPIIWDFVDNVTLQPFPTPCLNNTFLVIIVASHVGHVEYRKAHRKLIPEVELLKINATRVFLLGQISDSEKNITQSMINDESKTYGDILQGTFIDNYKNQTYKHLMGLKWASTTCQGASFILKVDDETVYNLTGTYALLNSINNTTDFIYGYKHINAEVLRSKEFERYVSWEEYSRPEYPTYVYGAYYITTPRVAAALCDEAIYHPYFWIDDVFVTGMLREPLGIKITDDLPGYTLDYLRSSDCYCCTDVSIGIKDFVCK